MVLDVSCFNLSLKTTVMNNKKQTSLCTSGLDLKADKISYQVAKRSRLPGPSTITQAKLFFKKLFLSFTGSFTSTAVGQSWTGVH